MRICQFIFIRWINRAQILCGSSHHPREGLWMIKISKISLQQNSIFIKFENPQFFYKIRQLFGGFCFTTFSDNQKTLE